MLARLWVRLRLPLVVACFVGGGILLSTPVWSAWWMHHVQAQQARVFAARLDAGAGVASLILPTAVARGGPGTTRPLPVRAGTPQAGPGPALAELRVPAIGLDAYVLDGLTYAPAVWTRLLRDGPAHLAGSAVPGQPGNVVIFGHLNIWGSVFYRLHRLHPGNRVVLTDPSGRFTYTVTGSRLIAPTDVAAVAPHHSGPATLQLVTCGGAFDQKRLLVDATLTGTAAPSSA